MKDAASSSQKHNLAAGQDLRQQMKILPKPRLVVLLIATTVTSLFLPSAIIEYAIPHYLLIHSVFEIGSSVASFLVFAVCFNALTSKDTDNLSLIAAVFLAVGLLDLCHMLAYQGMPDFIGSNSQNRHLNFWLAARCIAALGLLLVVTRRWDKPIGQWARLWLVGTVLIGVALIIWGATEHLKLLPEWYVEGEGPTALKLQVEYGVIVIHMLTIGVLATKKQEWIFFNPALLIGALIALTVSSVYFTVYLEMNGIFTFLGHLYKAIGYYLIYRAIVVENIERPYKILGETKKISNLLYQPLTRDFGATRLKLVFFICHQP